MELRQKVKSGEIQSKSKSKKNNKKNLPVHFKPSQAGLDGNAGPVYIQAAGESDRSFMQRVNKVVQEVIKESSFSERYKVNIKRNQETGEVEKVEKREKDPLELFSEQLKKEKKESKGKKKKKKLEENASKEQISNTQKKTRKLKLKKELKRKDVIEDLVEVRHEHVKFGEVAHAPPTLVKPKKVAKSMNAPRPGAKDLLLKGVFNQAGIKNSTTNKSPMKNMKKSPLQNKTIDRKGKRKNLPVALRRQLDNQQAEIIKAYKELKKQQYAK